MKSRFDDLLVVKVTRSDRREIQTTAAHLDLGEAETIRRSLRVGLKFLKQIEIPGSSKEGECKNL